MLKQNTPRQVARHFDRNKVQTKRRKFSSSMQLIQAESERKKFACRAEIAMTIDAEYSALWLDRALHKVYFCAVVKFT